MNTQARPAERQVIRAEEVAHLLGFKSRRSFDTKRPNLEGHGFPGKLPGLNGWSRIGILNWLAANGNVETEQENEQSHRPSRLSRRFG